MRKKLCLSSFALALLASSCVTVPNTKAVTVAGRLSMGAIWAETLTSNTGELSLGELTDLLEPQGERICVPVPGFNVCADEQSSGKMVKLPARAGAIIQPAEDWAAMKNALEKACRLAGSRCTLDIKQAIKYVEVRQ